MARLYPDQSFLSLCHRRVAGLSTLYKANADSNHCLFSNLPSASTRGRHTRAAAAPHPLEFEVSTCKTCLQGVYCPPGTYVKPRVHLVVTVVLYLFVFVFFLLVF